MGRILSFVVESLYHILSLNERFLSLQGSIAKRMVELARKHGMNVEENAMEYLVESVGNDIRQVLNVLQMWSRKSKSMSFAELKSRSGEVRNSLFFFLYKDYFY